MTISQAHHVSCPFAINRLVMLGVTQSRGADVYMIALAFFLFMFAILATSPFKRFYTGQHGPEQQPFLAARQAEDEQKAKSKESSDRPGDFDGPVKTVAPDPTTANSKAIPVEITTISKSDVSGLQQQRSTNQILPEPQSQKEKRQCHQNSVMSPDIENRRLTIARKRNKQYRKCMHCGQHSLDFTQHKKTCPGWPVNCNFCAEIVRREDYKAHLKHCSVAQLCRNCGNEVLDFKAHVKVCTKLPKITCRHCGWSAPKAALGDHLRIDCPFLNRDRSSMRK